MRLTGTDVIRPAAAPLCSGFFGDPVAGKLPDEVAIALKQGRFSFETLLTEAQAFGIRPDEVVELVRAAPMQQVVTDVIDTLRARFDALPGETFQKAWLCRLRNRVRHHVAPIAWRMSGAAGRWMRPEALARWVPAPEDAASLQKPIRDAAARKTLVSLMLLAGHEGRRHD